MSWLLPRDELTPDQIRAVELSPDENRLVIGGPGSGKTQILLHRADHLRELGKTAPDRFHIFVFTNVLKKYIHSALELLDLPLAGVSTLDAWCLDYHKRHIPGGTPWDERAKSPDFGAIRHAVLQCLHGLPAGQKPYDFVLVDEAQDLPAEALQLVRASARHVTAYLDRKQQIYEKGSDEDVVLRDLGIRRRNVALLDGFRCSPYVTKVASALLPDGAEAEAFIGQARTGQSERETPLLYYSDDFADEKRRLIEVLRVRLMAGETVAVLLPQNRQVHGFAKGMREEGLDVETKEELDFESECPKVLTYHSAKGLTFDSVLMPRLVARSFARGRNPSGLLFVGATRALRWIYFGTSAHESFGPLSKLRPLAGEGVITVEGDARRAPELFP